MVDALKTGPRANDVEIVLSPRNSERASRLASTYSGVTIAADNQAVVDASDFVFIGVLPGQITDVCGELSFRADQTIVSLIAGMPPSTVATLVAPATTVCQMIPLPVITMHAGPLVICPGNPEIVDLFEGCGELIVLEDEAHIFILSCTSASMSSFFQYQNTVIDWSAKVGLPENIAHMYSTSLFKGLATEAMNTAFEHLPEMPVEHETPGGLNAHIRSSLMSAGMFEELEKQLDHIYITRNRTKKAD